MLTLIKFYQFFQLQKVSCKAVIIFYYKINYGKKKTVIKSQEWIAMHK